MASISNKPNLFFITSPRSPYKMKEEILILINGFSGKCWKGNSDLQEQFYRKLAGSDFFIGSLSGDLALKARDRITRGPKSLGLVDLSPNIQFTDAGEQYTKGEFSSEAFTRQLLKFQLPSPFHIDENQTFFIKPYLELTRLIYELNGLSKDEIAAFVMQLTSIEKYQMIKQKIIDFRELVREKSKKTQNYKRIFEGVFSSEIRDLYSALILSGFTSTRESEDQSIDKFIKTKKSNHKDYADAAIRYLRETKLFSIRSSWSRKITIDPTKKKEVEFILNTIPREPIFINDLERYKEYLFDSTLPVLFTDDRVALINSINELSQEYSREELLQKSIFDLKSINLSLRNENLSRIVEEQIGILQTYDNYSEIVETYHSILSNDLIDPSLFMEWNTWRAFVMLDDGLIKGNFNLDDEGMPLSHAPGNVSDIICEYDNFDISVEVTLSRGATQYMMEGEPVPRHIGTWKKQTNKECYGVFIAQNLHPATIAHFYSLYRTSISFYGGIAKIIPLNLKEFMKMIDVANSRSVKPNVRNIEGFIISATNLALQSENEREWYGSIMNLIETWI